MNMLYLLELPADRFAARARDYLRRQGADAALQAAPDYFHAVMALAQPKLKSLEELPAYTACFFAEEFPVDPKVRERVLAKGDPRARLRELATALAGADFSTDAAIEEAIKRLAAEKGLGFGDYQGPARLAVSGTGVGPNLTGMFRVLGRERVLARLERFLAAKAD